MNGAAIATSWGAESDGARRPAAVGGRTHTCLLDALAERESRDRAETAGREVLWCLVSRTRPRRPDTGAEEFAG